jgi:hypothetical protein
MPQPRNSYAIAECERLDVGSHRCNTADDLVARDDRQARLSQVTIDHVEVGPANAAGCDLDKDLARAWRALR